MERIEFIVTQLEEAKRMIDLGGIPRFRLAFLLLDNVAELSMRRIIKENLLINNHTNLKSIKFWEQMLDISSENLDQERIRKTLESLKNETVPPKKVQRIESHFDEKAHFLAQRGVISHPLARTITKMHSYRNEVYHRDNIRHESIKPATTILFDVACLLFSKVRQQFVVWPLSDSLREICDRYGVKYEMFSPLDVCDTVARELRRQLDLNEETLKLALIEHLKSRIQHIEENLDFLISCLPIVDNREEMLKLVQFDRYSEEIELENVLSLKFRYREKDLIRWRKRAEDIRKEEERYRIFSRFADIEDELEPLENIVQKNVSETEKHINFRD